MADRRKHRPSAVQFGRSLVTPEGVDLRVTLASAGERASAFLIDITIIVATLVVVSIAAALLAAGTKGVSIAVIVWIVAFFFLRNFYFAGFELRARGATPGKRALGLRVVSRDGGRLTADAVLARNLLRELEFFLPLNLLLAQGQGVDAWIAIAALVWSGTFALLPLFNTDRMRVGDLLGGTWVVHMPRRELLPDLAHAQVPRLDVTAAQLAVYGIHELQTLENVLRLGDPTTMAAVATRIRSKIGWAGREDDRIFLEGFYAALRGHLELRLLFGHRRRDKYDKP